MGVWEEMDLMYQVPFGVFMTETAPIWPSYRTMPIKYKTDNKHSTTVMALKLQRCKHEPKDRCSGVGQYRRTWRSVAFYLPFEMGFVKNLTVDSENHLQLPGSVP